MDFDKTYAALSPVQQTLFLANLSHWLTICTRESYLTEDFTILRRANDFQQDLASQISQKLSNNICLRDDLSFASYVLAGCQDCKIPRHLVDKLILSLPPIDIDALTKPGPAS
jgi:hypothetical protein